MALVGVSYLLIGRVPHLGRLPGDIVIHRGSATFYVPVVTAIILSFALTLVANLAPRLFRWLFS